MKMKAAILRKILADRPYADSQPIQIEEVELDGPKPGEVLVKVTSAGLCHSDLSIIDGARPRPVPLALGHEGAGEVVEVGAGIRDLAPGDPVVFQFSASCGRCANCQSGRPQLCQAHSAARAKGELMGGGKRIRDASGAEVSHHSGVSCFAEYAVVDRGTCVKVDADAPVDIAAIFGCAVMTGVGAAVNTAALRPGQSAVVIGLGGVGFSALLGAKMAGASPLIAVDINPEKLGLARQLGADHTVDASEADHLDQIRDLTGGGVEVAIETAGSIKALQTGYASLATGGTLVTAGLAPAGAELPIHAADLVTREISVRGSYMGSCVPVRDIPRFIRAFNEGRLPVDRLVGSQVGFEEMNAGFDRLADGAAIRQILRPHAA